MVEKIFCKKRSYCKTCLLLCGVVLKFGSRVLMKNYYSSRSFCTFLAFVWKLGHCSFLRRLYSRSLSERERLPESSRADFFFISRGTYRGIALCNLSRRLSGWAWFALALLRYSVVLLRYSCGFKSALPKSWTTVCSLASHIHIWKLKTIY